MSNIFNKCESLISLPYISEWNMNNNKNIQNMFSECISLTFTPDLSKWIFSTFPDLYNIYDNCFSFVHFLICLLESKNNK